MRRARTCRWLRMRPYRVLLRGQGVFFAAQFSADCITIMAGFHLRQAQGHERSLHVTDKTSAEMLKTHIAGRLIADGGSDTRRDVIVQIFARNAVQESVIVPAVAEPLIVWILKGSATVEERNIGGNWLASDVKAGDFFLTDSDEPYELRWRSHDGAPFEVMHLYLGLSLLDRAMQEVHGTVSRPVLRDVSGVRDTELGLLLETLAREISGQTQPSSLLLESVAQAV